MFNRSKALCNGKKSPGPDDENCLVADKTRDEMRTYCHGDYHCHKGISEFLHLLLPECKDYTNELTVDFICGRNNVYFQIRI